MHDADIMSNMPAARRREENGSSTISGGRTDRCRKGYGVSKPLKRRIKANKYI